MIRGQEEAAQGEAPRHSATAPSVFSEQLFSEQQWRMLADFASQAALADTVEAVLAALITAITDNAEIGWALLYELQPLQQAVLRQTVRGEANSVLSPAQVDLQQDPTPWRLAIVAQTQHIEVVTDFNATSSSAVEASAGNAAENAALVIPLGPAGQPALALLVMAVTAATDTAVERYRLFATQLADRVSAVWAAVQRREAKQYQLQHDAQQVYTSLETILASMSDVVVMLDRDWRYTYVNERAIASSGFSKAYLLGRTIWEVFPDLVDTAFAEQLQRAVREQQMLSFEYYYAPWNRWFENRIYPSVRGLSLFSTDITGRKRTEAALRESDERFRQMAETIPSVFWLFDPQTRELLYVSPAYRTLWGRDPQVLFSDFEQWLDTIHPADRQQMKAAPERCMTQGNHDVEYRVIRPDGSLCWIRDRGFLIRDAEGQPYRLAGIAEDITERKQSESAQRLLTEASAVLMTSLDYQTTLRNIARLVVPTLADYCYFDVVGADGQTQRVAWQHCNPERQTWFDQIQQFVPPPSFQAHPAAAALSSGQPQLVAVTTDAWMESIAISPEHLQFMHEAELCSLITVPLIARDRCLGVLTCCFTHESNRRYGATELVLAEELAHRAALALDNADLYRQAQDANRIKDEFLAVLSHELRSPLNPILGWTRLLQTREFDASTTAQALQTIERNAKLQTQLIEDLLDVSRILRGKMSLTMGPVELTSVIEAAIETVRLPAEAKGIELSFAEHGRASTSPPFAAAPPLCFVMGDPARLQQVVWNLLSNAVKFTPAGGRVAVRLEEVGSRQAGIENRDDPCYAQLTVTDTGKGIRPDFLPHVFEYFRQEDGKTTRQFGGLGLGLAIVRCLIELHGGTVWVESAGEGQGATFGFRLPLLPGPAPVLAASREATLDEAAAAQLSGLRILAVDDEADMRELMTVLLQQQGAIVQTVASAAEALEALEEFQPDLLISDIGMPVMDGYMLMQQIRRRPGAQQGQIPAIALTAYAAEADQEQAHRAGFQKHVAKPVDPRDLVAAILSLASTR